MDDNEDQEIIKQNNRIQLVFDKIKKLENILTDAEELLKSLKNDRQKLEKKIEELKKEYDLT